MDGCALYAVVGCVPSIVVLCVGTQLPWRLVMMHRPNAGAGGRCYLFLSKLVRVKVGYLCPLNSYGESVRLTHAHLFAVFVQNTLCL